MSKALQKPLKHPFELMECLEAMLQTFLLPFCVGRQSSRGLLHFCTSCEQRPWQLLFLTIFSRMYSEQSWKIEVVLSMKQSACLFMVQYDKDNFSLCGKGWFACHHYIWKKSQFLSPRIPQLWHKPTACIDFS